MFFHLYHEYGIIAVEFNDYIEFNKNTFLKNYSLNDLAENKKMQTFHATT